METTKSEAVEYISGELVLWIVLAVVACALLIWANFYLAKRYPVKRDWYFDIYLVMAVFVIFFFCLAPVNQARRHVLAFMLQATLFIAFFKGLDIRGLITQKKIKPLVEFVVYSILVILSINIIKETRHFHPRDCPALRRACQVAQIGGQSKGHLKI